MKPEKTFRPRGSRIKLYSDSLEIEEFGCLFSSKKTSYIPLQEITKVYTRSGWLYIETEDEDYKFHFEKSASRYDSSTDSSVSSTEDDIFGAQRAAKEINKVIQEGIDQQHPEYEYIPPKSGGFISLLRVGHGNPRCSVFRNLSGTR